MGSPKRISEKEFPSSGTAHPVPFAPDTSPLVSASGTTSNTSAVSTDQESSTAASLDAALSSLTLCEPDADRMFRALATIFEASQLHDARIAFNNLPAGDDVWTLLQRAVSHEGQGLRDVPSLIAVKNVMDQMLSLQSQFLLPALRVVADKSREASWRIPFGESGLMDFGSSVLSADSASDDLKIQALRLIGNACADTDDNRQRVLQSGDLESIVRQLESPSLASVTIPVLYNICRDFEPAQTEVFRTNLLSSMIELLNNGSLDSTPSFGYLCRLFDMCEENVDGSTSPDETVESLLQASIRLDIDVDDFVTLMDTALLHLRQSRFQNILIENDHFDLILKFLIRTYTTSVDLSEDELPDPTSLRISIRDPEDEKELSRIRLAVIQTLAEISSLSAFTSQYSSFENSTTGTLKKWLAAPQAQLQQCSCIVLGNLACSDEVCAGMVSDSGIVRGLFSILKNSSDSQVIHSALGYLRNLALPEDNKNLLGAAGAIEILNRFWTTDALPQISHLAAGSVRQLVNGSLSNVRKLLTSLSSDKDSPAFSRTYLSLLLSTYDKSDDIAVKTEVARVITAMLRCIHGQQTLQPAREELLFRLYTLHPDLARPLGAMVVQSQFPIIRSEGWFGFALIARSGRGRLLISNIVSDVSVFGALEKAIKGEPREPRAETTSLSASPLSAYASPVSPSPQSGSMAQQEREMRSKDRQNAMILVNELLRNGDENTLNRIERDQLEDLLHAGSRAD